VSTQQWLSVSSLNGLYERGTHEHSPSTSKYILLQQYPLQHVPIPDYYCQTILLNSYLFAGALDGGTQVISFILNFAVFGAAGEAHAFPEW
jgi:hypothetical protein